MNGGRAGRIDGTNAERQEGGGMGSRASLCVLCLASVVTSCVEGESTTTPTQVPTPLPTPSGSFAIVSSAPAFNATVTGRESDLQGISDLAVTFQMTYPESLSNVYFSLQLFGGSTECLRSQIAYSRRLHSSPAWAYAAGTTAVYRSEFFVRDNQQPGCGASFTTNRIRFVLQDRNQVDPGTGQLRTLYFQDVSGGWTFAFAR
jgi:hypothetical protein